MIKQVRFGRKLRMPPTSVIKHELRMMAATDSLVEGLQSDGRTPTELGAIIGSFIDKYHIPVDRAHMLMDRLRVDRSFLKVA